MILNSLQPTRPGVPALHELELREFLLLKFSRWQIGPQVVPLRDSTTEVKALLNLLLHSGHSSRYDFFALNIPLVSTVPCIQNLWNTIHRFPKDKVHKGRMDCMSRWRIQGTVQSHPYATCMLPLHTLPIALWKRKRVTQRRE